jgi:tRNA 2-thiouridine synthesizing protein A
MADNRDVPLLVDARGLACPLPVLRLRKALQAAAPGAIVTLLATDRVALRDVPAFCRGAGHAVIEAGEEGDGGLRFVVRRG